MVYKIIGLALLPPTRAMRLQKGLSETKKVQSYAKNYETKNAHDFSKCLIRCIKPHKQPEKGEVNQNEAIAISVASIQKLRKSKSKEL